MKIHRFVFFLKDCLQLAEDSVELQKENETLISLQKKRQQIEIKRDLNKHIKSSLIQNMTGMAEVNFNDLITLFFQFLLLCLFSLPF
jgi:hypothetical protein